MGNNIRHLKRFLKEASELYLNLAASYLKVKDFSNAMSACNETLKIDEKNIKALYRRSRCRT